MQLKLSQVFRWEKDFSKYFLRLAVPIILQNLVASSLFIVDNIMVGRMGKFELAAVTQANQWAFLFQLFVFGVASGGSVLVAQYWGKKDIDKVRNVMGVAFLSAAGIIMIFALPAIFFPKFILSIYSQDPKVIELGAQYLSIVGFGYIISGLNAVFSMMVKSTEQVVLPMITSICAIVTNTLLNYTLIFGNFGMPALGVRGAAIATVCAAAVDFVLLVGGAYLLRLPVATTFRKMMPPDFSFIKRFFKIAVPVVLNEGLWALGMSMYSVVYGRMGTDTVASMSIYGTIDKLLYIMVVGIVHACAIVVGMHVGKGEKDKAFLYAGRALFAGFCVTAASGLILFFTRGSIVTIFNVPDHVRLTAAVLLGYASFQVIVRAFCWIGVVGVMRAGGDAVYCMRLDVSCVWLVGVPLVCFAGLIMKLPIEYVLLFAFVEEYARLIIGARRLWSRKWIKNVTVEAVKEG